MIRDFRQRNSGLFVTSKDKETPKRILRTRRTGSGVDENGIHFIFWKTKKQKCRQKVRPEPTRLTRELRNP
jgi:hypothetical protein